MVQRVDIIIAETEVGHEFGPKFEVAHKPGSDVADNDGVKWIWLDCPHCGSRSKFHPAFHARVTRGQKEVVVETDHHYLSTCDFFGDVVYIKFWEVDIDPDWTIQYETHYPIVGNQISEQLPKLVHASFNEAGRCLNANAAIATVVMCRRTIEAVVKDQGSSKRNLIDGIKDLVASKTLPDSLGALADVVRMVGNVGAHASEDEVKQSQAREMYDLTKALVDAVYITPHRVANIRSKLDAEKAAKITGTQSRQKP
jgi:hypothetical protein